MNLTFLLFNYNFIVSNVAQFRSSSTNFFLIKTKFILNYYLINELLWQEGFLIDFLQKKLIDNWTKKFLIHSSYLFNERLAFERIIRFYLDYLIWPLHRFFIFELHNVSGILFINLFLFLLLLFTLFITAVFSILF